VFLISRLAEHTANIDADSRASLLVHESGADIQAASRLTLVGDAARVDTGLDALQARYLNFFPDAENLLALGGFAFYRIEPVQLRFIGGFGDIRWISAASYSPPANTLDEQEPAIIAHMNADHAHNVRDYCRHFRQQDALGAAVMAGLDCDGFDVRADGNWLRFDFARPVTDAASARDALVAMAREARGE
jgi:putative heme iron utilization protein